MLLNALILAWVCLVTWASPGFALPVSVLRAPQRADERAGLEELTEALASGTLTAGHATERGRAGLEERVGKSLRVAIVGDSQRARLALTELVRNGVPVVAWAAHTPAEKRIPFLTRSSTHSTFPAEDVRIKGDPERGNILIEIGSQKESIRPLVFKPGSTGNDTRSAQQVVEMLVTMGVDTVVLDGEGLLNIETLSQKGIRVIVLDQPAESHGPAVSIPGIQSQTAFRVGKALREWADRIDAKVQFAQLKLVEPNETTQPTTYRIPGAAELHVTQMDLYQRQLREGLGLGEEESYRVPKTLRLGYPIRQGLILTVVVGIDRPTQTKEVRDLFEELAKRDGFFVIPEEDALINTERIAGEPGVYLYGEPIVQTTEDGRSLIQVNFIADPLQTQLNQLVQLLQGKEPRVPIPIRSYQEIAQEMEPTVEDRKLADATKTDLAEDVRALTERFGRKWRVEETQRALREKRLEPPEAIPLLFDRNLSDFSRVEFLEGPAHDRVGLVALSNEGILFATSLLSADQPEEESSLQQNYYQQLRNRVFQKEATLPMQVRDVYHPAENLSAVWEVRGEKEFLLREIVQSESGKDRVLARPETLYHPLEPDEMAVFVNGAGGRIGSQTFRLIAGDALDPEGKTQPLSGKLIPVGAGVSNFEDEEGRKVTGAESLARLIRTGDPSSGPFLGGEVTHGYQNGAREDWIGVTAKGRAVRIPVFGDRIFRNPENLPLGSFLLAGIPVAVIEGTRMPNYTNLHGLNKYLWAGAERVSLLNPGSSKEDHWQTHTFIFGVNDEEFHPAKKQISNASCTTACASTLSDALEQVGAGLLAGSALPEHLLKEYRNPFTGVAMTYHAFTGEKYGVDGAYDLEEKAQGRVVAGVAAYLTPTGFSKAGKMVLPEVTATGDAVRGPWATGSVLALVVDVPGHWQVEDIRRLVEGSKDLNKTFQLTTGVSSSHQILRMFGELASLHVVVDEGHVQVVHIKDNWGRPRSLVTLPAWYENEWGYSTGVVRFLDEVVRPSRIPSPIDTPRLSKFPQRLSAIPEEGRVLYSDRVFLDQMEEAELERRFKGKTIFVRADYNVVQPVLTQMDNGKFEVLPQITEDFRILATVPDLERLLKAGARLVLASHNGRFADLVRNRIGYSIEIVTKRLAELLGREVQFSKKTVGPDVRSLVSSLKDGEILLLENLRMNPGEEAGDVDYAEKLAQAVRPDAYVLLAFGAAHRGGHASITPLMDLLRSQKPNIPVVAGELIHRELDGLKKFLNDPRASQSGVAILGGAKPEDKIEVMRGLILNRRVKKISIVGAMSLYFYIARGFSVGNSFLEDDVKDVERSVQSAFEILRLAEEKGIEVVLPVGYRGLFHSMDKERPSDLKPEDTRVLKMEGKGLPSGFYAYSVDHATVREITKVIQEASWVVLNGTAGMVEVPAFRSENDEILSALDNKINSKDATQALLLGGDGVAAFSLWARAAYGEDFLRKLPKGYTLSTGGGASLELMARLVLSGLAPLDIQVEKGKVQGDGARIGIYGNLKWRLRTRQGLRDHLKEMVAESKKIPGIEAIDNVLFVPSDLANDPELISVVQDSPIRLGLQNIKLPGENTNELTAEEGQRLGYTHVLIGHSDRRSGRLTMDGKPETDTVVNARLREALRAGLIPLFLFGENREARLIEIADPTQRWKFIDRQLKEGLTGVDPNEAPEILFGYEPAWAIGKQSAGSFYADVQLKHARESLSEIFGRETAEKLVLGYGGGTNERNVHSFLSRRQIDFVVPGRPSAELRSFTQMIEQTVSFSQHHLQPSATAGPSTSLRTGLEEGPLLAIWKMNKDKPAYLHSLEWPRLLEKWDQFGPLVEKHLEDPDSPIPPFFLWEMLLSESWEAEMERRDPRQWVWLADEILPRWEGGEGSSQGGQRLQELRMLAALDRLLLKRAQGNVDAEDLVARHRRILSVWHQEFSQGDPHRLSEQLAVSFLKSLKEVAGLSPEGREPLWPRAEMQRTFEGIQKAWAQEGRPTVWEASHLMPEHLPLLAELPRDQVAALFESILPRILYRSPKGYDSMGTLDQAASFKGLWLAAAGRPELKGVFLASLAKSPVEKILDPLLEIAADYPEVRTQILQFLAVLLNLKGWFFTDQNLPWVNLIYLMNRIETPEQHLWMQQVNRLLLKGYSGKIGVPRSSRLRDLTRSLENPDSFGPDLNGFIRQQAHHVGGVHVLDLALLRLHWWSTGDKTPLVEYLKKLNTFDARETLNWLADRETAPEAKELGPVLQQVLQKLSERPGGSQWDLDVKLLATVRGEDLQSVRRDLKENGVPGLKRLFDREILLVRLLWRMYAPRSAEAALKAIQKLHRKQQSIAGWPGEEMERFLAAFRGGDRLAALQALTELHSAVRQEILQPSQYPRWGTSHHEFYLREYDATSQVHHGIRAVRGHDPRNLSFQLYILLEYVRPLAGQLAGWLIYQAQQEPTWLDQARMLKGLLQWLEATGPGSQPLEDLLELAGSERITPARLQLIGKQLLATLDQMAARQDEQIGETTDAVASVLEEEELNPEILEGMGLKTLPAGRIWEPRLRPHLGRQILTHRQAVVAARAFATLLGDRLNQPGEGELLRPIQTGSGESRGAPRDWVPLTASVAESGGLEHLGNKFRNLMLLHQWGHPVPPAAGFPIGKEAQEVVRRMEEGVARVEGQIQDRTLQMELGARFADLENPLLLSVRSGALVDLPGQLATLENVGIHLNLLPALEKRIGSWAAWDAYRRFVQDFAVSVYGSRRGFTPELFDRIIEGYKQKAGVEKKIQLSAEQMKEIALEYDQAVRLLVPGGIPEDPWEQLKLAIQAVVDSWDQPHVQPILEIFGLQHEKGTAVILQAMIHGNFSQQVDGVEGHERSGAGVASVSSDGDVPGKGFVGSFGQGAQGSDVADGVITPEPLSRLEELMPEVFKELQDRARDIQEKNGEEREIEFTVQNGGLWFLQDRSVPIRGWVPKFNREAVEASISLGRGMGLAGGAARGILAFPKSLEDPVRLDELNQLAGRKGVKGLLLAMDTATPKDTRFLRMRGVIGFLAHRGGPGQHEGMIANLLGLTAVAGLSGMGLKRDNPAGGVDFHGVHLEEGELVSVDGFSGAVYPGRIPLATESSDVPSAGPATEHERAGLEENDWTRLSFTLYEDPNPGQDRRAVFHGFHPKGYQLWITLLESSGGSEKLGLRLTDSKGTPVSQADVVILRAGVVLDKILQTSPEIRSRIWDDTRGSFNFMDPETLRALTGSALLESLAGNRAKILELEAKEGLPSPDKVGLTITLQPDQDKSVLFFSTLGADSQRWELLGGVALGNKLGQMVFLAPAAVVIDRESIFREKERAVELVGRAKQAGKIGQTFETEEGSVTVIPLAQQTPPARLYLQQGLEVRRKLTDSVQVIGIGSTKAHAQNTWTTDPPKRGDVGIFSKQFISDSQRVPDWLPATGFQPPSLLVTKEISRKLSAEVIAFYANRAASTGTVVIPLDRVSSVSYVEVEGTAYAVLLSA